MRSHRLRCASGGPQEDRFGGGALIPVDVHSAHLAHTRAGPITVWVTASGVRRIEFGGLPRGHHLTPRDAWPELLRRTVDQLSEYFEKQRSEFDLPLDLSDATTGFQHEIYDRLGRTPYGQVTSYGQIAKDIGKPDMARAVGQAVGANPVPIVVPCHRVIASDGRLTGFAGGLPAKVALLKLEGIDVTGDRPNSKVQPGVIPLDL